MKKLAAGAALVLTTTGLAAATVPAQAARAQLVSTYACSSQYGDVATDVGVSGRLPAQVQRGEEVPARDIRFGIVVPEELVDQMRQFGVRSVAGDATGARVRVGQQKVRLRGLDLPRTPLPASGPLVLEGSGRMAAFTLSTAGRYPVRIPATFDAEVRATTSSGTFTLDLDCGVQPGAPTRIGSVTVVD